MLAPTYCARYGSVGLSSDPYRVLAAAIIRRAALDARLGDAEARHWLLFSPWCALLLEMLLVDRRTVHRWVLAI